METEKQEYTYQALADLLRAVNRKNGIEDYGFSISLEFQKHKVGVRGEKVEIWWKDKNGNTCHQPFYGLGDCINHLKYGMERSIVSKKRAVKVRKKKRKNGIHRKK